MSRLALTGFCLCAVLLVSGCAPSTPSDKKTPSSPPAPVAEDAAKSGSSAKPDVPEALKPPATPEAKSTPSTDTAVPNAPAPVEPPSTPAPDTAPPTPPAADSQPAEKFPYEDLVSAAGSIQLNDLYRQSETALIAEPDNIELQLQRMAVLNAAAMRLGARGDQDHSLEASRAAFTLLQPLMAKLPDSMPEGLGGFLAMVLYNGACAQAQDGKAEEALATLQQAVDLGLDDLNMLRDDEDLAAVRALPGFDQRLEAWTNTIRQRYVQQAEATLAAGETFPFDFTLTDIKGQPISLSSLLGKVVIVDIWGTWCPPCRAEIPSFIQLQTELGPQGLQIVGLNYEHAQTDAEKIELVQKFIDEVGINYPCALITDEVQRQVPDFEGFPTTLFIDRSGHVRAKLVGLHDLAFLQALVEHLLAEPAAPPADAASTPPADAGATPTPPPAEPAAPAPTDPASGGQ